MSRAEREQRIRKAEEFLRRRISSGQKNLIYNSAYMDDASEYRARMITPYEELLQLIHDMYQTIQYYERRKKCENT